MGSWVEFKRKKGIVYRAKVSMGGHVLTKMFPKSEMKAMLKWITIEEAAILQGIYRPKIAKHTVAEAVDKYIEEIIPRHLQTETSGKDHGRNRATQLQWFKAHWGDLLITDITPMLMFQAQTKLFSGETYGLDKRKGRKATQESRSAATVNKYIIALGQLLQKCKKPWGWISEVPTLDDDDSPPKSKRERRSLTPAEARKVKDILQLQPQHFRLAVLLMSLYGSRRGETCKITWDQVHLDANPPCLEFRKTKNKTNRSVPLTTKVMSELKAWRKTTPFPDSPFVFPAMRLTKKQGWVVQKSKRGYTCGNVGRKFSRIMKENGFPGITLHCLRHTFATLAAKNGHKSDSLGEFLGNPHAIGDYIHLDTSDHIGKVELMERILFGEEPKTSSVEGEIFH